MSPTTILLSFKVGMKLAGLSCPIWLYKHSTNSVFWAIFICSGTTTRRKDSILWYKGSSSTLAKQKYLVIPQHLQEKGGGLGLYRFKTFRCITVWESLFHGTRWVSCLLQAYQFKSLFSGISAGFAQYENRLHRALTRLPWSCSSKIQNCQSVRKIPTRNTALWKMTRSSIGLLGFL